MLSVYYYYCHFEPFTTWTSFPSTTGNWYNWLTVSAGYTGIKQYCKFKDDTI